LGFKGSCHSTNYATQAIAENEIQIAIQLGIKSVEVKIKGLGYGKEYSLHGLQLKNYLPLPIPLDKSPLFFKFAKTPHLKTP
jgi:ribosomal protein S11